LPGRVNLDGQSRRNSKAVPSLSQAAH